ncbi:aminotransferase class III-fold pyridoxal phosphate-dependent enzyme [Streptomyces sp. AV19]|uniref:aminotransferase class III-fold pyridoxal phosphate-dependent enzyme n=1 Tax=Streptomyces sp. AV19 TaxID=2793068 RepID=UPI0018FED1AE|nr:aminotransferase class III-fold pyridoxal phosphate-dependent enzyme [Streptomyces sp. AV19]MBH1934151.1 aminotransferase class III-fold pyridoxal phosphate-dependent enzyme [Streptomyces sp. AV19]MDG4533676.1 aminotransferase class III-fold pyridoxal phosphate-dependent enzyme [Streptomyces sp. AV19]
MDALPYAGVLRAAEESASGTRTWVPDLAVLGKALGGGLPVSLAAGPRELLAAVPPLRQTSTFSANPVAAPRVR